MAIAGMVLGIVAVIISLIPCVGWMGGVPLAIVGLVLSFLGFNAAKKANQPKGMAVAGIVLNLVALLFSVVWTLLFAGAATAATAGLTEFGKEMSKAAETAAKATEAAAEAAAAAATNVPPPTAP